METPETPLDIDEVAKRLGVSPGTVRTLVKEGELPAYRIRRQLRFMPSDVEAYFKAQRIKPKQQGQQHSP